MDNINNLTVPVEVMYLEKPLVDSWIPKPEDFILRNTKDSISMPVSEFFGLYGDERDPLLDAFDTSSKKCYSQDIVKPHIITYINYFLKYFDLDKELLSIYCNLKYIIDIEDLYTEEDFIRDIQKYVFSDSILMKFSMMNEYNYNITLNAEAKKKEHLQYTDKHGMVLMCCSLLMNAVIPLITHFIYKKNIMDINGFTLRIFSLIFQLFKTVDVYSKLVETANDIVDTSKKRNEKLWAMQDIRGINMNIHVLNCVENTILHIIPKYNYTQNFIKMNHTSVKMTTGFSILDAKYEYDFHSLSGSKRDDDDNSEFDKYESQLIKQDEGLYIQTTVNYMQTMKRIEFEYGPFNQDEINFYLKNIESISGLQKKLVFLLFYPYFGDPISIKSINEEDYIKLLISAVKIFKSSRFIMLPYIISSNMTKTINRQNLNKREYNKVINSEHYTAIVNKYRSDKIIKDMLTIIATILSSSFQILDFYDKELNGKQLNVESDYLCEEIQLLIKNA